MGCSHGRILVDGDDDFGEIKQQCINDGELYTDDSFPLLDRIFIDNESQVDVKWLRPKEICELENSTAKFIHGEPTRFDIRQGSLGDCWFLSSIANMAQHQTCFEHVVPSDNGDFESEDYSGIFHFRFWKYGRWVDVVIDDYLPTSDGKLVFVHSEYTNVFWSALLEKAFAKFHGSYGHINGGFEAESFEYLTGGIGECYQLRNAMEERLFHQILIYLERKYLISCTIDSMGDADKSTNLKNKAGLIDGHAYSLTGAKEVSQGTLLVRVRNPWGSNVEWKGAWSDASKEWNTISAEEREEMALTFDDDGEFWMRWEDFLKYFYKIDIGFLNPFSFYQADDVCEKSSVYTLTIDSKWTDKNIVPSESSENNKNAQNEENGHTEVMEIRNEENQQNSEKDDSGCETETTNESEEIVNRKSEKETEIFTAVEPRLKPEYLAKSPQYILSVNKPPEGNETEVYKTVVCLMVKNRRENIINGEFDASALKIHLYKADNQELPLKHNFTKDFFENNNPLKGTHGVNYAEEKILGLDLAIGEYCLVLSSEKEEEFFVRIYSDNPDMKIQSLTSDNSDDDIIDEIWSLIFP